MRAFFVLALLLGGFALGALVLADTKNETPPDGRLMNAPGLTINCVSSIDGKTLWRARATAPRSPPALAEGNIYAGTSHGLLYCLKTGDQDADGWYAWGGNARHNKAHE